ncbi:MAG: hypothetical protein BAJALOKI1v1_1910001 [Promethearchaeota archaeon]|nr:MAG: hypothetical protein BAJALOKI1v1_1910001 [Candidatus Lokiarchaeota archaeon]
MNIQDQIRTKIRKLSMAPNEEFEVLFDQYIAIIINLISCSEELDGEFIDYSGVYQLTIDDIDFSFWFEIKNDKISYQKGLYEDPNIQFFIKKEILITILNLNSDATDAYMRGLIRAKGKLSYALRFRNIIKIIIKYILHITKGI